MDAFFILAQVTGIIGWVFLIYSYYKEDIDKLLFIQIISSVFYCLNYFFLGAISGLVVCVFELIKGIGYYKTDKDDLIFLISIPIYILIAYFSYDSWISLLPVIGSVIDALTLTKSRKVAVAGGMISNIIWVIYDILILSYSCALTDGVLVLSNLSILLIGYSRLIRSDNIRIINSMYITRSVFKKIHKLDEENYDKKYLWDIDYQEEIFDQNKKSFSIITYNESIIGYVNYLCIKESELLRIINSNDMINEYSKDSIIKFYKSKKNYILLESICVQKKFQNYKVSKKIKNNISKLIKNRYKKGYIIDSIVCFAVSEFEKNILEEANFDLVKNFDNGESLYLLAKENINKYYLTKQYIKTEEKNKYKIYIGESIIKEDIDKIYEIDSNFYPKKYLWDKEYFDALTNKSKEGLIVLKYNGNLIGYFRYIPISENLYNKMKKSDDLINEYDLDDVNKLVKSRNNYVILKSIYINPDYHDGYAIQLLTKSLKKNIKNKIRNGYKIYGMIGTSISKESEKFAEQLGLNYYKNLIGVNKLYLLEGKNNINEIFMK